MNNDLKRRWQQLAGLRTASVKEKQQLNESFANLGITNVGVVGGNPFGNRQQQPKYNFDGVLDELDFDEKVEGKCEVKSTRNQLKQMKKQIEQLLKKMPEDAKLEDWVQSKLTLASEMLDVVFHCVNEKDEDEQMVLVDNQEENSD